MTNAQALAVLERNPEARVYFETTDATGRWPRAVYVSAEDGRLVQPHPTDPRGDAVAAPHDVVYHYDTSARGAYDEHGTRIS